MGVFQGHALHFLGTIKTRTKTKNTDKTPPVAAENSGLYSFAFDVPFRAPAVRVAVSALGWLDERPPPRFPK